MSFQQVGQFLLAVALFALLGLLVWKNYLAPKPEVTAIPAVFDQQFTDFTARQYGALGQGALRGAEHGALAGLISLESAGSSPATATT